jgi:uracil-DNA glycosylase
MMNSWKEFVATQKDASYMPFLKQALKDERSKHNIYPPNNQIFTAFKLTPFDKVRCVLLGQDPYYWKGQAFGLAYSVNKGVVVPGSLVNIYKELHDDVGFKIPTHGYLTEWADRGVLLTNSMLTVREGLSSSHAGLGWQNFTDAAIAALSKHREGIVFVLWGNYAKSKAPLIDEKKHLIIRGVHPSPRSADKGFFGSKPFSKINDYFTEKGEDPIDWSITE